MLKISIFLIQILLSSILMVNTLLINNATNDALRNKVKPVTDLDGAFSSLELQKSQNGSSVVNDLLQGFLSFVKQLKNRNISPEVDLLHQPSVHESTETKSDDGSNDRERQSHFQHVNNSARNAFISDTGIGENPPAFTPQQLQEFNRYSSTNVENTKMFNSNDMKKIKDIDYETVKQGSRGSSKGPSIKDAKAFPAKFSTTFNVFHEPTIRSHSSITENSPKIKKKYASEEEPLFSKLPEIHQRKKWKENREKNNQESEFHEHKLSSSGHDQVSARNSDNINQKQLHEEEFQYVVNFDTPTTYKPKIGLSEITNKDLSSLRYENTPTSGTSFKDKLTSGSRSKDILTSVSRSRDMPTTGSRSKDIPEINLSQEQRKKGSKFRDQSTNSEVMEHASHQDKIIFTEPNKILSFPDYNLPLFPDSRVHQFPNSGVYPLPHASVYPFSAPNVNPLSDSNNLSPFPDSNVYPLSVPNANLFSDSNQPTFPDFNLTTFPESNISLFPDSNISPIPDPNVSPFPDSNTSPFPDSKITYSNYVDPFRTVDMLAYSQAQNLGKSQEIKDNSENEPHLAISYDESPTKSSDFIEITSLEQWRDRQRKRNNDQIINKVPFNNEKLQSEHNSETKYENTSMDRDNPLYRNTDSKIRNALIEDSRLENMNADVEEWKRNQERQTTESKDTTLDHITKIKKKLLAHKIPIFEKKIDPKNLLQKIEVRSPESSIKEISLERSMQNTQPDKPSLKEKKMIAVIKKIKKLQKSLHKPEDITRFKKFLSHNVNNIPNIKIESKDIEKMSTDLNISNNGTFLQAGNDNSFPQRLLSKEAEFINRSPDLPDLFREDFMPLKNRSVLHAHEVRANHDTRSLFRPINQNTLGTKNQGVDAFLSSGSISSPSETVVEGESLSVKKSPENTFASIPNTNDIERVTGKKVRIVSTKIPPPPKRILIRMKEQLETESKLALNNVKSNAVPNPRNSPTFKVIHLPAVSITSKSNVKTQKPFTNFVKSTGQHSPRFLPHIDDPKFSSSKHMKTNFKVISDNRNTKLKNQSLHSQNQVRNVSEKKLSKEFSLEKSPAQFSRRPPSKIPFKSLHLPEKKRLKKQNKVPDIEDQAVKIPLVIRYSLRTPDFDISAIKEEIQENFLISSFLPFDSSRTNQKLKNASIFKKPEFPLELISSTSNNELSTSPVINGRNTNKQNRLQNKATLGTRGTASSQGSVGINTLNAFTSLKQEEETRFGMPNKLSQPNTRPEAGNPTQNGAAFGSIPQNFVNFNQHPIVGGFNGFQNNFGRFPVLNQVHQNALNFQNPAFVNRNPFPSFRQNIPFTVFGNRFQPQEIPAALGNPLARGHLNPFLHQQGFPPAQFPQQSNFPNTFGFRTGPNLNFPFLNVHPSISNRQPISNRFIGGSSNKPFTMFSDQTPNVKSPVLTVQSLHQNRSPNAKSSSGQPSHNSVSSLPKMESLLAGPGGSSFIFFKLNSDEYNVTFAN